MSGELILKIIDGEPDILVSHNKDGRTEKKVVTANSLISSLANSYVFSTGILPKGTKFFSGTDHKYCIGIETSPMIRLSSIVNRKTLAKEKFALPLPPCLFTIFVTAGKVISTFVHALIGPIFDEACLLYKFPYGNVGYDGRVCWGCVTLPDVKSPMAIATIVGMFLDSEYNGDLFESGTIKASALGLKGDFIFTDVIDSLKGKEKFPPEALVADGNQNRVSYFLRGKE